MFVLASNLALALALSLILSLTLPGHRRPWFKAIVTKIKTNDKNVIECYRIELGVMGGVEGYKYVGMCLNILRCSRVIIHVLLLFGDDNSSGDEGLGVMGGVEGYKYVRMFQNILRCSRLIIHILLLLGDDDSSGDEGLGVMGGVEGRQGPKRSRTILTPSQRKVFKESFEVTRKKGKKYRIVAERARKMRYCGEKG